MQDIVLIQMVLRQAVERVLLAFGLVFGLESIAVVVFRVAIVVTFAVRIFVVLVVAIALRVALRDDELGRDRELAACRGELARVAGLYALVMEKGR